MKCTMCKIEISNPGTCKACVIKTQGILKLMKKPKGK